MTLIQVKPGEVPISSFDAVQFGLDATKAGGHYEALRLRDGNKAVSLGVDQPQKRTGSSKGDSGRFRRSSRVAGAAFQSASDPCRDTAVGHP
eukprot:CAMPEP_0172605410 /NCGR_PEP_ID=MMETSP1068-20121228/25657_1 /TAXON_ID=35684 /ORGANISM="Pseudopedinella elastica, Strain CCMP716" /LENGTH=91 /DNA_ID=CAMNT_0013407813 /DNA_START=354 /DNA_END=631 /DNA_ORIENTATION=-